MIRYLLLVFLALVSFHAPAQQMADRETAYNACIADAQSRTAGSTTRNYFCYPNSDSTPTAYQTSGTCAKNQLVGVYYTSKATSNTYACQAGGGPWSWAVTCLNGGTWDSSQNKCKAPCSQRPAVQNKMVRGSINTCYDGCEYAPDAEGFSVRLGNGSGTISGGTSWRPTGQACGSQPPPEPFDPNRPTCNPVPGNMIECVKPNGQHCITGSTGASNCWSPFETGPRLTADGTLGGDREVAPTTPTPPTNQTNSTVTTTTNTTINNNTYNTSISTGSGISGAGQVGSGVKGDSNGDGKLGEGESGGDGDTDFGNVGAGVGTLYTKSTDTVGSLMTGFFTQLNATPIAQGITNFMMVQGGGTCPVFVLPASRWWDSMVLDMHCNGDFYNFLLACGWVIFAMASYVAVKMAMT